MQSCCNHLVQVAKEMEHGTLSEEDGQLVGSHAEAQYCDGESQEDLRTLDTQQEVAAKIKQEFDACLVPGSKEPFQYKLFWSLN